MTAATADAPSDSAYTRLHVTPLDPELTKVVLSAAILPRARNISYHHLETFPEKRYGFVDLPTEDAEKLKKKLNGSVVKGVKIRIERAKPERIPTALGAEAMGKRKESEGKGAGEPKLKKRKRNAELEGVVLEEGRKVKRGWTTTDEKSRKDKKEKNDKKDKKERKQAKSKYTDHPECLVKTVLPPNATEGVAESRSKKKKGKSREVIIHEFEKTTKFPTFLKSTADNSKQKAPLEFVEDKGWVDEAGNVVETVKASRPKDIVAKIPSKKRKPQPKEEDSSESSSSGSDSDSEPEPAPKTSPLRPTTTPNNKSSGSASSDSENEAEPPAKATTSKPASKDDNSSSSDSDSDSPPSPRPKSSSSAKNLTIRIPPVTPPKESNTVHPLEALYKRPADSTTTQDAPGFSFFGGANDDIEEDPDTTMTSQVPMTPFSRQDFENRGLRSAAPTPDTAHPSRRLAPWDQDEDDIIEDEEDEQIGEGSPVQRGGNAAPSSDFQKWFWENRGDINRSWRKRRKTAGKEKRYRENRARTARAI